MGAWGTGIFDNDTTCDVRDNFYELLEESGEDEEFEERKKILNELQSKLIGANK